MMRCDTHNKVRYSPLGLLLDQYRTFHLYEIDDTWFLKDPDTKRDCQYFHSLKLAHSEAVRYLDGRDRIGRVVIDVNRLPVCVAQKTWNYKRQCFDLVTLDDWESLAQIASELIKA